jgi:glycogen operon protein
VPLTLPDAEYGAGWEVVVDTSGEREAGAELAAGASSDVGAHALLVLRERMHT